MKTYTVHRKTAYSNIMLIVAAKNERTALDIAKVEETFYSLDRTKTYIPDDYEFEVNIIKNVYSKDEGVKSKIFL